jgi:acyl-CoA dehydrogenase
VWISRVQHSDLMILLARTTPVSDVRKKSEGLSIFLVDLHQAIGNGLCVKPIRNMVNHQTNELFFDDLEIPADSLIGEEGRGFRYILDGLNAERTLIAAECVGDGYWFVDKVVAYAKERIVFDRPIGQNQGVQFPIARAYVNVEAANLMRFEAAKKFDTREECGAEANMAKLLAADASSEAANACIQFHGDFAFAADMTWSASFARHDSIKWRQSQPTSSCPISPSMFSACRVPSEFGVHRRTGCRLACVSARPKMCR